MDAEAFPPDISAEEEPKYLRRQKPVAIKRRKFGRQAWRSYFRTAGILLLLAAGLSLVVGIARFLFFSPRMALLHPSQIAVTGNHYVAPSAILEIFSPDRDRSVLRIPLEERRRQIESLPWVEQARVLRILPNQLQVNITERVPVAWLRNGADLALIDAHGVILDRQSDADFHFPVVTGLSTDVPLDERARRMATFQDFIGQIDSVHQEASELVSEADLSSARDVRVIFERLPGEDANAAKVAGTPAMVVHFGDRDFQGKFRALADNIAQWRSAAGHIDSVDLRFGREAVINSDAASAAVPPVSGVPGVDSAGAAASDGPAPAASPGASSSNGRRP